VSRILFAGILIGVVLTILSGIGTVLYMTRGLPPRSDPIAMECYRGDVFHSGVSRKNYTCTEDLKWREVPRSTSGIAP
jgi:hypothetical protein